MMLYFEVMRASYGAITLEYLERVPIDKLTYLVRAARIAKLVEATEAIRNINLGFAGSKEEINKLYTQIEFLSLVEPVREEDKLRKYKKMMRQKFRAMKKKLQGKKGKK